MSDELRSARRHRAPTPSGARGRCEAPKVALPPRISPSGADCMVHAGAHRRHAPCGRAARAGVRTTPGRRRADTPAQSRLRRLLAEATWKSDVGTAFGSNLRTSGHRLFLRRHLSIRRRHRGTERDTARGRRHNRVWPLASAQGAERAAREDTKSQAERRSALTERAEDHPRAALLT